MLTTHTFDAANRLVETMQGGTTRQPITFVLGDRTAQTSGITTTFALDVQGLPEVLYTSDGERYLHLPGLILTDDGSQTRYLLGDGLGSIRHAVDETAAVVAYHEFDPYGSPVEGGGEPYGFTGEWWENEVGLLYLRARWYQPEVGIFVSRDPVESEPPYLYVRGNVVNRIDPSGYSPNANPERYSYSCKCGWIDWEHAQPGQGAFIYSRVRAAQNESSNSEYLSFLLGENFIPRGRKLGMDVALGVEGVIAVNTDLSQMEIQEVALGIFVSVQNLLEAGQAGETGAGGGMVSFIGGRNSASSFSEEDLMSDLIGFYMGLHQEGDSLGMNRQTIERICDVVTQGASSSRKKAIQEQILDEYNYPFQKITAWGQPRLDGWDRELDDCPSKTCSQPRRMPAEFSRILPKPPGRPYWYWDLAWATMIIEGNRYDDYLSGDDLNSRELNWSPPHLPIITR